MLKITKRRKRMTLKEIYQQQKELPTPAQLFVQELANITCREETTIRQWLSGVQEPPRRAKISIAKHLSLPVDELFPAGDNEIEEDDL